MTDEDMAVRNHEIGRTLTKKLTGKLTERGMLPVDAVIGVLYGAGDAAAAMHNGDAHSAIEWMRTLFDLMERQLLDNAAAKH